GLGETKERARHRAHHGYPRAGAAHLPPALAGASAGNRKGRRERPFAQRSGRSAGAPRGHREVPGDGGQARAPRAGRAVPAQQPERALMNDIEGWIYFDGPEPEHIRPLLDALREDALRALSPATPEDKERLSRRFFEK